MLNRGNFALRSLAERLAHYLRIPPGLMFRDGSADTKNMEQKTTLLEAVWNADGDAETVTAQVKARLKSGILVLTGTFKGHEAELTAEAGDWERN